MAQDDTGRRLEHPMFLLGLVIAFAGAALAVLMSLVDLLQGRAISIGDTQKMAVMGGLIITAFGAFLALMAVDIGVRHNLERLSKVHSKFSPGKARDVWRILWPLGAVGAIGGLFLCGAIAGLDILRGQEVSIGGAQEAAMFASFAVVLLGIMMMAAGTRQVAASYDPILVKMQGFRIMEPGPAQPVERRPLPRSVPKVAPEKAGPETAATPSSEEGKAKEPMPMATVSKTIATEEPAQPRTTEPMEGPRPAIISMEVLEGEGAVPSEPVPEEASREEVEEEEAVEVKEEEEAEVEGLEEGLKEGIAEEASKLGVLEWSMITGTAPTEEKPADDSGDEAAQPETGIVEGMIEKSVLDDILTDISSTKLDMTPKLPSLNGSTPEEATGVVPVVEVTEETPAQRESGSVDVGPFGDSASGSGKAGKACPNCGQAIRPDWSMCPFCDNVLPY